MPTPQARYWIATVPAESHWMPYVDNDKLIWLRGQLEEGAGGYRHWQVAAAFSKKVSLKAAKEYFNATTHLEISRSDAVDDYVWKEDTRVADTQFELGKKASKRNAPEDWQATWTAAQEGKLDLIPADVRIRCYNQIKRIGLDFMVPMPRPTIQVHCFWGVSGSGKTHQAIELLGDGYYDKLPTTKFWDGYRGEENVLIDEFRGKIDISHLLKWFDKYKCSVECKGAGFPLKATTFVITSNIRPREWYPEADEETKNALCRRMNIREFVFARPN